MKPEAAGSGDKSANLNIKLSLLNKVGGVIKSYSPTTLSARIDTILRPARYYLVVEGVNTAYIPDYGSVGKYTITGSAVATATLTQPIELMGISQGTNHILEWSVNPDIHVSDVEILQSADGKSFTPVQHVQPETYTFNNPVAKAATMFYKIKVTDDIQEEHFSKIISLTGDNRATLSVVANATERTLQIKSADAGDYEIFTTNGQLYQRGKLMQGSNLVHVQGKQNGMFVLKNLSRTGSTAVKFIFP